MAISERLVCKRDDGGVSIIVLAEGTTKERGEQDAIKQGLTNFRWMPLENLPTDREFRDAWCDVTNGLSIDMDLSKAKDIQISRLRLKRDELLKKYDGLGFQAMDIGDNDKLSEVRTKKQELRDATNALKALTPDSIKQIKDATPSLEGF